jgi:tripartite-type tricarboxylate transporter receptor subunit TctC
LKEENMKGFCLKTCFVIALSLIGLAPFPVMGQGDYPTRPVTVLLGHPPGGNNDTGFRILAEAASKNLGQPVVVENKPGGNSFLAYVTGVNSRPDGYTFCDLSSMKYDLSVMYEKVPRSVDEASIIGCYFSVVHGVAVKADAPWKTFKELVEYARSHPGSVTYAVPLGGSPAHLAMVMLGKQEKIDWKAVPFQGLPPCITAVLGGHVNVTAGIAGVQLEHVKAGKLRLLAVQGNTRLPGYPDVPTLKDLGYDITASFDTGLAGPKGIDPSILKKLRSAFGEAVKDPKFQKFLKDNNLPLTYMEADQYYQYLKRTSEIRAPLIKELGLAYK